MTAASDDLPSDDSTVPSTESLQIERVEDLYLLVGKQLFAHLFKLLMSKQDAEDVLQQTFVQAAENWHTRRQLDLRSSVKWIQAIAKNLALNVIRRRKIRSEVAMDQDDYSVVHALVPTHTAPDKVCDVLAALDVLRCLPPRQREIYILRHYFALSATDIAVDLELAAGTVRFYLSIAQQEIIHELGRRGCQATEPGPQLEDR